MNLTDRIKDYFQKTGWFLFSINLICLTIAAVFLQTRPFSPKVRIVLYSIVLVFIYLVNYVSFILFSTEKFFLQTKFWKRRQNVIAKATIECRIICFPCR